MRDFLDKEEAPDYVIDPNQLVGTSGTLVNLVADIADRLEHHYPGWMWAVQPFEFGGIIKIFSLRLSGEYGFTMKVADIQDDPNRKLAMEAGGEILERFNMPRVPYRRELTRYRLRDLSGNLVPDITDKSQRAQRQDRDRKIDKALMDGSLRIKTVDREQPNGETHREIFMQIGGDDA